jgi:hypothetical protein
MPTLTLSRRLAPWILLVAIGITPRLAAQRTDAESTTVHRTHAVPVPSTIAAPRLGTIVLDGRLDDDAWSKAIPVTSFTQIDPEEGKPASQRTEVRFVYDEDALYVGARMYDTAGPAGIVTRLVRRDADMESDWFQVVIDAYHDHLGRAFFQINPSGVKFDALGVGGSNPDPSWDPIWEAATRIDSAGWTAELRIPYSQLHFSRQEVQTWGLQIRRFIQRRNEQDQWAFWTKTEVGGPSRFGHLEGLRIAHVPQHLEAVPYVVGRSRHIRPSAPGDPFNDGSLQDMRVGGDLKALLTSNFTLDATINPDFGQVEVDPASVNLSAFETFYAEKRPFFVAGSGIFDFGNASCYFCSNFSSVESFYSRRIGRSPQGAGLARDAGTYADVPESATILGAAKITGRTATGTTVGLLNAVTRREMADVVDSTGSRFTREVEPLTNYFVGRATQDYRGGDLVVGGIATSVLRRLDDGALRDRLTRHAEALGADLVAQWDRKTYSLFATAEYSNIAGSPAAILRAQRSSARYYQRPDREFRHGAFLSGFYDSSATSMSGLATYVRVAKDGGHLNWEAQVNARTPGFEVNDISFLSRAGYVQEIYNLSYNWTRPTSWYRNIAFIVGGQQQQNFEGLLTNRDVHFWVGGQTPQFWNWNGWVLRVPQSYDEALLRGGPVAVTPTLDIASANVTTDARRAVVLNLNPQFRHDAGGGFRSQINGSARWKPASNVSLSVGPSWAFSRGAQQYVTSVADPTSAAFYGRRYVLSDIVQKTLSMDTRLAVTFTPTSTLELYAQPFIATGAYSAFKELDAPRQVHKSVYGVDRGTLEPGAYGTLIDANGDKVCTPFASPPAGGVPTECYRIDPDAGGPAVAFSIGNPDFNFRALRGNAVYRWEYKPGSTLFLVWTQSREDNAQNLGDFQLGRDRTALFAAHPDNIFLVKLSYWLGR